MRMGKPSVTVINDENFRGVIAPASVLSQEMLEDLVDIVEYSRPGAIARVNSAFKKTGKLTEGRKLRKEVGA